MGINPRLCHALVLAPAGAPPGGYHSDAVLREPDRHTAHEGEDGGASARVVDGRSRKTVPPLHLNVEPVQKLLERNHRYVLPHLENF